jgi:hypothetical protein
MARRKPDVRPGVLVVALVGLVGNVSVLAAWGGWLPVVGVGCAVVALAMWFNRLRWAALKVARDCTEAGEGDRG